MILRRSLLFLVVVLLVNVESVHANVLGSSQTFQPSPDDTAFLTMHSSYRMRRNQFNLGVYLSYMRDSLSVFSNQPGSDYVYYQDNAVQNDLVAAWQFARQWQFQMTVSANLWQQADDDQFVDGFIRDLQVTEGVLVWRPAIKYSFRRDPTGISAAIVGSVDFPTSSSDPYLGFRTDPIYNVEGVLDWIKNGNGYGINLGYRHRTAVARPVNSFALPLPSQFIASTGMVIGVKEKVRYHVELFSSLPANQGRYPSMASASSLEVLGGAGWYFSEGFNVKAGGTVEVLDQSLAPTFRLFAGLNYRFGGEDSRQSAPPAPAKEAATAEPDAEPLTVSPKKIVLRVGETKTVAIRGGVEPLNAYVDGGVGSFDLITDTYTAPEAPGKTFIHIRDRQGASVQVAVTVLPPKREAVPPLTAQPEKLELLTGAAAPVQVDGGSLPYTYRLEPPFGEFDESTLTYQAPVKPGSMVLIVSDQRSQVLRIPIVVRAPEKAKRTFQIANLNFFVGTAKLTPEGERVLNANLEQLRSIRIRHLLVVGHTDSTGDEGYNLKLSRLRAQTVRDILEKELALQKAQVDAIGYGETSPLTTNATPAGRAKNRRVELRVIEN